MPAAAVMTLVITAVVVLALAAYLIKVVIVLRHVNDTLGKITFGVRAIAHRTEPIGAIVGAINEDLHAVAGALDAAVASTAPSTTIHRVA